MLFRSADRRSQNFGFHMIAGSQTITDDRTWFYLLRSSAITIARSQNLLRSAIRDRLRSYGNQPLQRSVRGSGKLHLVRLQFTFLAFILQNVEGKISTSFTLQRMLVKVVLLPWKVKCLLTLKYLSLNSFSRAFL